MILLIHGEENFLSQKKLNQIEQRFLKEGDANNIEKLDDKNFEIANLEKIITTVPFFGNQRLIILKDIIEKKYQEKELKKISDLLKNVPETTIIVFYNSDKVDHRDKLFKIISEKADKNWLFKKFETKEIYTWANKKIKDINSSISKDALDQLILWTDNDLWLLNEEIEKITTFKGTKQVTIEDVNSMSTAKIDANIFNFIDSISQKNKKTTIINLEKLFKKGEDPIYLMGMIVYQIRNLLIIKELSQRGMSCSDISKKTRKHPFVVKKTLAQAENFSFKKIENVYQKLFETEIALKRGLKNPKIAINVLALKLCS
jgi:DNA polymerase-3 subunit delta